MLQVLSCRLSADFSYAALEISDTGFTGIIMDDLFQRGILDYQLVFLQAAAVFLLLHQVIAGNMELLIFRIAVDLKDLHTV